MAEIKFLNSLKIEQVIGADGRPQNGGKDWRVIGGLRYTVDGVEHEVEDGFITDGASVPRPLWWFAPPLFGPYARSAVVHDKRTREEPENQRLWDREFLEAMTADGTSPIRRRLMFRAVSLFQWARGRY